jgi:DNA-binding PadR family transcriptional regulator
MAMPSPRPKPSALGLLVLWQLYQEPLHVYGMQKRFEAQNKDRVVNVRSRASLYQAIERLRRLDLVGVHETVRIEGYPDRIVYAITDRGREVAREWLREMLRSRGDEYPEFIAALSVFFGLAPEDAREQFEERERSLAAELDETERSLRDAPPELPRLFLIEEEYRKTLLEAELTWLRGVIDDLRAGRLDWSLEWLQQISDRFMPPPDQHDQENDT